MKKLLALSLLGPLAMACGASSGESVEQSEALIVSAENPSSPEDPDHGICVHASEADCLADVTGCAWGEQEGGPACFFVGEVGVQPTPADPTPEPDMPTVCTHNASEAACLADPGCAWVADEAACIYVGQIDAYTP